MSLSTAADVYAAGLSAFRSQVLTNTNAPGRGNATFASFLNLNHYLLAGSMGAPAAAPGTACDKTLGGAMAMPNVSAGHNLRVGRLRSMLDLTTGALFLVDRLVECLIDPTITTTQTINTIALPARATGGEGVWMGIEAHLSMTGAGASTPTATVVYTNQAGTTGQTTSASMGIGWSALDLGRRWIIPLASGDTGVQSIQSITFNNAATAGVTTGVGVTLFKPVVMFDSKFRFWSGAAPGSQIEDWLDTGMAIVDKDACLEMDMVTGPGTVATNSLWLEAELLVN